MNVKFGGNLINMSLAMSLTSSYITDGLVFLAIEHK
jgi:hypothetical protein